MTQTDRSTPPPIHDIETFELPEQSTRTLSNGVKLNILSSPSYDVTRLVAVWPRGIESIDDAAAIPLMLNMMTEGTGEYPAEQLNDTLDYSGAFIREGVAAHYMTLTAFMLNRTASTVLPIYASMITCPSFDADYFDAIRVKRGIQADEQAKRVITHASASDARMLLGDTHPLSRVLTSEDYANVTADRLKCLHADRIKGHKPVLYAAGNVTDEVIALIDATLGQIAFGDRQAVKAKPMTPSEERHTITTHHPGTMQAAIALSIPAIPRSHPDYIPLRITVMALGGYFGSRLNANIREDKGYTYGITAGLMGYDEGGVITVNTQCDCRYVDDVIAETRRELERMKSEAPTGEELETLRRYMTSILMGTTDNAFTISDYYINMMTLHTPVDYMRQQIEWIRRITSEDIARMARNYFDTARMYVSVATQ